MIMIEHEKVRGFPLIENKSLPAEFGAVTIQDQVLAILASYGPMWADWSLLRITPAKGSRASYLAELARPYAKNKTVSVDLRDDSADWEA